MRKESKAEKKLSLKKIQHIQLNSIRGGGGPKEMDGNVTNGDTTETTGSKHCQVKTYE